MELTRYWWSEKWAKISWNGIFILFLVYISMFLLSFLPINLEIHIFAIIIFTMVDIARLAWLVHILRTTMLPLDLEIILQGQYFVMNGVRTWHLRKQLSCWKNACVYSYIVTDQLSTSSRCDSFLQASYLDCLNITLYPWRVDGSFLPILTNYPLLAWK